MIPGYDTQHLIDEWLLKTIFTGQDSKNDYRFNVLKAYVNAVASPLHIDHLIQRNKYERLVRKVKFPFPSSGYLEELEEKVNTILVSHKQAKKVITTRSFWRKKRLRKSES